MKSSREAYYRALFAAFYMAPADSEDAELLRRIIHRRIPDFEERAQLAAPFFLDLTPLTEDDLETAG